MSKFTNIFLVFAFGLFLVPTVFALDVPLGNKGLNTGVVNPVGFNFIYEAQYYNGFMKDNNWGTAKNGNSKVQQSVFATDFVVEWNTPLKIFGANYSFDFVVPFINLNVGDFNASGVADFYVDPIMLGWKTPRLDVKLIIGANLPVGSYDVSFHHFSLAAGVAMTGYLTDDRRLKLSAYPLYEYHFKDLDSDKIVGSDFVVKWGLGYDIGIHTIGIIGYSYVQLAKDQGTAPTVSNVKQQVHAAGLQYNVYVDELKSVFQILVNQEFAARNRALGTRVHFVFVKLF